MADALAGPGTPALRHLPEPAGTGHPRVHGRIVRPGAWRARTHLHCAAHLLRRQRAVLRSAQQEPRAGQD